MKHLIFLLFWALLATMASAQPIGIALNGGIRKTFNLGKKTSLELRQQFQVNPEIERYNNKYGDFFNEDGFWPIPDRYRDDDDDDDEYPPSAGSGIPDNGGELGDAPYRIEFNWRSTTSTQYNYRFFPWLRANAGYSGAIEDKALRHTFRAECDYRPFKHGKQKHKVDFGIRTLFQYIGSPDKSEYEWHPLLVPRVDVDWAFKKKHLLQWTTALNGEWESGGFAFDRWRTNLNLVFIYQKIHRFTLGYQFQQRLDKPKRSHGLSFGYEIRI